MSRRRLVLASASPARLTMLRAAGFDPHVVVSGVDEDEVQTTDAKELCRTLAERKAMAVAVRQGVGALVVGCDSVLELEGEVYGKPADADEARKRWARMAGQSGVLHTGHCVVHTTDGRRESGVASTTVRFGRPTEAELEAYLATGEPLRVAGAFTIDGYGGMFVDGIDGDHGTVVGISLPMLRALLAKLDVPITDLWNGSPP